MKKLVSVIALASLVALGGSAIADLCTIDARPAATLLLPHFEVDTAIPPTKDTFFSVNNASAAAVLTHVIFWTDWSIEALDFHIYLTGYDTQLVNMGDIIRNGNLPVTAPEDDISPVGPFSLGQGSYANCGSILPYTNPALINQVDGQGHTQLAHVQAALTGNEDPFFGGCAGQSFGDTIARGYVTVDVVKDCTLKVPCDTGYYEADGSGVGDYTNVIWGDYYLIDYANAAATGDTLVHVEADPTYLPGGQPDGKLGNGSFWNRCSLGAAPYADYREPLGTTYAAHYYADSSIGVGAWVDVWRDDLDNCQDANTCEVSCGDTPTAIADQTTRQVVVFDNEENTFIPVCPISPCPPGVNVNFQLETQRVSVTDPVTGGGLGATEPDGWIYLNLNQVCGTDQNGQPNASCLDQAYVSVHEQAGSYAAGLSAAQLDSVCDDASVILGVPPDFPAFDPVCDPYSGAGCAF